MVEQQPSIKQYLFTQNVTEENIKFREQVLGEQISNRGWYGKLVLKYQQWHTERKGGAEYFTDDEYDNDDDDDDDDGDDDDDDEDEPWFKTYISPSKHVLTLDDGNTSDDGLDDMRESVKILCAKQDKWLAGEMVKLLRQKNETSSDPIVESFMSNLQKVKSPKHGSLYTLKIQLLNIREDIHRVVKVPARLSLCALQEKVICPLMGWLPNLVPYAFFLATNKYADGEKPEDPKEDVCISSVGMNSGPSLVEPAITRGSPHMIDDRRVAVFQVLQGKNDHMYYQHGRYCSNGSSSGNYKVIVVDIAECDEDVVGVEGLDAVQVLSGRGPVPDECGAKPSWEDPRCYDEYGGDTGIYGTKAFCISMEIVQNRSDHEDWVGASWRKLRNI